MAVKQGSEWRRLAGVAAVVAALGTLGACSSGGGHVGFGLGGGGRGGDVGGGVGGGTGGGAGGGGGGG
ncbi:MAG: hypothetical protein JSR41_15995, partial [Proteobacteria bacterium]|nr:hypothetical protein [Pseudomonadota bacterium]